MEDKHIPTGPWTDDVSRLADEGKTPLVFANDDGVIGIIAAADMEKQAVPRPFLNLPNGH